MAGLPGMGAGTDSPRDPYIHPDHAGNAGNAPLDTYDDDGTKNSGPHDEYGPKGSTPGPLDPQNRGMSGFGSKSYPVETK